MSLHQKTQEIAFHPSDEMGLVINQIEKERSRLTNSAWYMNKKIGCFLFVMPFIIFFIHRCIFIYVFIIIILVIFYMAYKQFKLNLILQKQYPIYIEKVILPILSEVMTDFSYREESSIFEKYYSEFTKKFPELKVKSAEDLVEGKIDGVEVTFGDIRITTGTGDDSETNNYFCFVANFNKQLKFNTVLFSKFAQSFAANIPSSKKIPLENQEFNKVYTTYSQNEVESRYILNPSFMEKMLKISELMRGCFWFQGDKMMFLGDFSSIEDNLFDIDINRDIYEKTEETYIIMHQLKAIVNELDLNTVIWKS